MRSAIRVSLDLSRAAIVSGITFAISASERSCCCCKLQLSMLHQRECIEDQRRIDDADRRQGMAGNQIAQLPIGRQQHPVDRRKIEREQQEHEGVDEKPEKPFPVLDTEEEQNCACKQVIDVQVARDPEHPDRIKLPEADDQDQRDRNEVFAEPMPKRQNESRNDQHNIIDVEQPQSAQVVERRDHDVRQAARDACISRDIDAALAPYDLRIARHDSDRESRSSQRGSASPRFGSRRIRSRSRAMRLLLRKVSSCQYVAYAASPVAAKSSFACWPSHRAFTARPRVLLIGAGNHAFATT